MKKETIEVENFDEILKGESIAFMARAIRSANIPVHPSAKPYFDAMLYLYSFKDTYGQDSASSIVCYFLANAQTMKGDLMRAIKKELNSQLKAHRSQNAR